MAHLIHPSSFPRDWLCDGLLFSWHEPGSSNFFVAPNKPPPRGSLRFDIPPSPGAWNAATRGGSWLSSGTFGAGLRSDWTATPCDRRWRLNTKPAMDIQFALTTTATWRGWNDSTCICCPCSALDVLLPPRTLATTASERRLEIEVSCSNICHETTTSSRLSSPVGWAGTLPTKHSRSPR